MAEFPALPLWTDAYLADTTGLSCLESGAYLHLLIACWRTKDCRLPNDENRLMRFARCTPREWRQVRAAVLEFWTVSECEQFLTQKKLISVREKVREKSQNAEQAAKARWLKDNETDNAGASENGQYSMHNGMQNPCAADANQNQNQKGKKEGTNVPSKEKRGRRWGDDELVPEEWVAWAIEKEGMTEHDARREADRFVDFWRGRSGAKATKVDWPATWRNWIRNRTDASGQRAPAAQSGASQAKRPSGGGLLGAVLRDEHRKRQG